MWMPALVSLLVSIVYLVQARHRKNLQIGKKKEREKDSTPDQNLDGFTIALHFIIIFVSCFCAFLLFFCNILYI